MRLISLKINPQGVNGWESPLLKFGERTTLLFAENGSGKTPVIQSLAFCLGFPTKFRDDISSKCASATLVVSHENETLEITRHLGREFLASIKTQSGVYEYFSEGEFSEALFDVLGMEPPVLVSTSKQATQPYIATVLPLLYLNQGDGYTTSYKSPASFIEDQFVEMVRFVFGLNPKHSYRVKKDLLAEKDALEAINKKIVYLQNVIENLSRSIDDSEANQRALSDRAQTLTQQIENLRETVDAHGSANAVLVDLLGKKDAQIVAVSSEINDLKSRVYGIESIRLEIEGEIRTLGLNEESRRVFTSFQEICAVPNCGLFVGSAESYGKSLFYLKDQIKDLQRNADRAEMRAEFLGTQREELLEERASLATSIGEPTATGIDQLVTAVHALAKQLVATENDRGSIEGLKTEKAKFYKLDEERSNIQEKIDRLTTNTRSDLEFNKLRLRLRELAVKWMDILEASNASRNVEIDLELRFKFGGEPLEVFSGSTKIRLVLAIHAAIFEEYVSVDSRPFRFIILDTPKQQEIHTRDLATYLHKLEEVCASRNAQMLLSSTEYHHPTTESDAEWLPSYSGVDHPMYLGLPQDRLST